MLPNLFPAEHYAARYNRQCASPASTKTSGKAVPKDTLDPQVYPASRNNPPWSYRTTTEITQQHTRLPFPFGREPKGRFNELRRPRYCLDTLQSPSLQEGNWQELQVVMTELTESPLTLFGHRSPGGLMVSTPAAGYLLKACAIRANNCDTTPIPER